jgi:hypothetical protein
LSWLSQIAEGKILDAVKEALYKDKCRKILTKFSTKHPRLRPNFAKIDEIFANYEIYKKYIHNNMKEEGDPAISEPMMDSHKIAASFFCSFLKTKPLTYTPDNSNIPPTGMELRANEHGAFLFGLQIVQDFWADKYISALSAEDKEIYKNIVKLPNTSSDNYIHWFIKLVTDGVEKYLDHQDAKFEGKLIFFIAHIYFLLEEFSYQFYRAELYEKRSGYLATELTKLKLTLT